MDDYPSEAVLREIETWDCFDLVKLVSFLGNIWHFGDWGFKVTGKKVLRLQLHTGGWSGNESIIGALQNNFMFWSLCWLRSERGGHYYFKIQTRLCTKKEGHDDGVRGKAAGKA